MTLRMRRFMVNLQQMPVVKQDDGSLRLTFWINGSQVCKNFFKSAAAIPTKAFDTTIAYVQGDDTNKAVRTLCCNERLSTHHVKKLWSPTYMCLGQILLLVLTPTRTKRERHPRDLIPTRSELKMLLKSNFQVNEEQEIVM